MSETVHTNEYNVLMSLITSNGYKLDEFINGQLPEYYIRGFITRDEYEELIIKAKENALPEYPGLQEQIIELQSKIENLESIVQSLKEALEQNSGEEIEFKPDKKYQEYKQPLNATDAYYNGMGCIENGIKYNCIAPEGYAVTWPPSILPEMWQEVTE